MRSLTVAFFIRHRSSVSSTHSNFFLISSSGSKSGALIAALAMITSTCMYREHQDGVHGEAWEQGGACTWQQDRTHLGKLLVVVLLILLHLREEGAVRSLQELFLLFLEGLARLPPQSIEH